MLPLARLYYDRHGIGLYFLSGRQCPPTEARIQIAVCNLASEGLLGSATSWLSELITRDIEKTDNLTTTEMLECGSDTKRALNLGKQEPPR